MTSKDAHDDPYQAQLRPFILPCAECGETEQISGLRLVEGGTINTPLDPLCKDCTEIHLRVWGNQGLSPMSPGEKTSSTEDGLTLYVVLCPRCDGTGRWMGDGMCRECSGYRYSLLDTKGVRRTARWWQTYQQNRTKVTPDA